MAEEKIIGIDLGTTNSVAAVMSGGEPTVIPSAEGERLVPSVVAVNKNHERLVGRVARNQAITNPQNTVFSIKRFMGRQFREVGEESRRVPYKVTQAPSGDVRIHVSLATGGTATATVWCCDLTDGYVRINADYTT